MMPVTRKRHDLTRNRLRRLRRASLSCSSSNQHCQRPQAAERRPSRDEVTVTSRSVRPGRSRDGRGPAVTVTVAPTVTVTVTAATVTVTVLPGTEYPAGPGPGIADSVVA